MLIGAVDYRGGGALYLLAPDELDPQQVKKAELTGLPEIWSLASYDENHPLGPRTVVVAGTACAGLRRHHFPVDATQITAPVATNGLGGSRLVCDVAIHLDPSVETIAFAALHKAAAGLGPGVVAVDLANDGLTVVATAVPELSSTLDPDATYCRSVAVDSDSARLFVGLGDYFAVEWSYAHPDDMPMSCDGAIGVPTAQGVIVYRWELGALVYEAEFTSAVPPFQKTLTTRAVSVRPRTATDYGIDVSGFSGLWSLEAQLVGGAWVISAPSGVGFDYDDKVIINQSNELLVLDDVLYASGELCLATWTLGASLLEPANVVLAEPANTLAGYLGPAARLFASGAAGSLVFDIVTDPLTPAPIAPIVPRQGRGFALRSTPAIPATQSQSGQELHWIVEVNYGDDSTTEGPRIQPSGGLHVYAIDDAVPATITEVASWRHRGLFQGQELPNAELRDIGFLGDTWYVSTSPRKATPGLYPADTHLTLLVLQVLVPPAVQATRIHLVAKLPISVGVPIDEDDVSFRVTVDAGRDLVYVALGKQGAAVFDISADPLAPVQIGHRMLPGQLAGNEGMAVECYHCLPGAADKLYVSCLGRGVWVIDDVWDIAASTATFQRTRNQAFGILRDPGDSSGKRIFVADGTAGVLHVDLDPTP